MASIRSKSSMVVAVVVMIVVPCFFTPATALGRKVGGKMRLKGVETNQEVQQLGRFCVKEYNRMYAPTHGQVIVFCHVLSAEMQVVSGIKYDLKIEGRQHGETKVFESVVVVKPWVQSKKLVAFTHSPTTYFQ